MHPVVSETHKIIVDNQLLSQSEIVIVGISGGPDSTALLHILASLRSRLNISLLAVYIDHGLRPQETPGEIQLVSHYTNVLQVENTIGKVDTVRYATKNKLSTEHAARELRYDFLRECARQAKATAIAVAHTADDQAEEILLRLIRGSGRKGLSGMSLKSREIIRPLLPFRKQRLLDYLQEMKVSFCEDSSNRKSDFLRNRVRHQLLPFLEQNFDSGIRQSLIKSGTNLAEDEDLLEEMTRAALFEVVPNWSQDSPILTSCTITKDKFCDKPRALQRRMIEKILWRLGSSARYAHIVRIVEAASTGRTGSELHLSKGLRVGIFKTYLEFSYPQGKHPWRGRLFRP